MMDPAGGGSGFIVYQPEPPQALIHLKLLSLLADSQSSHDAEWLSGTIHGLGEKGIRTGGSLLHDNIPSNFSSLRLSVVDERSEQVYSLFGPSCSLIPSSTLPQGDRQRSPVLLQKRLGLLP